MPDPEKDGEKSVPHEGTAAERIAEAAVRRTAFAWAAKTWLEIQERWRNPWRPI